MVSMEWLQKRIIPLVSTINSASAILLSIASKHSGCKLPPVENEHVIDTIPLYATTVIECGYVAQNVALQHTVKDSLWLSAMQQRETILFAVHKVEYHIVQMHYIDFE